MYLQVYALKDGMRKGKIRILIGRADSATLEEALSMPWLTRYKPQIDSLVILVRLRRSLTSLMCITMSWYP